MRLRAIVFVRIAGLNIATGTTGPAIEKFLGDKPDRVCRRIELVGRVSVSVHVG
jgi:hypothetical protein